MGAKGKYNPEIVKQICHEIRNGLPNASAAAIVGINHDTFYDWMKNKPDFSDAVKEAQSGFKRDQLTIIREASLPRYDREGRLVRRGSWQAACWLLERKFPEEFGMRWAGELTGKGGKPLVPATPEKPPVDWSAFSTGQLKDLLKALTPALDASGSSHEPTNGANGA